MDKERTRNTRNKRKSQNLRLCGLRFPFISRVSRSVLLCIFVIPALTVSAQMRFDTWTIDNGLPQNSVQSILQTRDGYLWLTTLNGLVRFDGVRFTVFDKSNTPALQSNRLTILYEDPKGTLWIGDENFGLTTYSQGLFTKVLPGNGFRWSDHVSLNEESARSPWTAVQVTFYRQSESSLTPRRFSYAAEERDPVKIDKARWEILPGKDGLIVYREGQSTTYTTQDGLSSSKITTIHQDGKGSVWIGTEDGGLNRFQNGKFTVYGKKDGLPSENLRISAVCEDRRGGIWIALYDGPLYRLKDGVLQSYTSADGLPSRLIQSIYEDREGSIWFGSSGAGLARWSENVVRVYSRKDGLTSDNIYPIVEDRSGDVWIGAWPGLNRYQGNKFIERPELKSIRTGTIASLYEDSKGVLWIGTYGGGIFQLKDGQLSRLAVPSPTDANGWLAILQDRRGIFWFGTTHGLFKYDQGKVSRLTTEDGLPDRQVNALLEDRNGDLWIATLGGVARLKGKTIASFTEKDGLSANHVRSFYEDEDGTLWIGTYDGGLNRFKDGRFTRYTMRDGLFDNGVFRILDDKQGNFWMSSNRGIYRVNYQELEDYAAGKIQTITTVGYGKGDGMLNAECNGGVQSAGARMSDGRLWFPTQQGVAVIDPAALHANSLPPPVLIEEFTLDDRQIEFDGGVKVLPGQERFEIRYTALSFIKPEQVRFKYKLEGLDDDWIDAGARRTVNYSYVPPGSYTFRVMAANSDGVWNIAGAGLPIVVQAPFYRTWWFLILSGLGVTAALAFGYQYRVRKLEREKTAQQVFSRKLIDSQENERQRIAAELHDSLSQSLVIIKNRALLGLQKPGDEESAGGQFEEIADAAVSAIDEVKEIAYALRPFHLDRLGLVKAIEVMLERIGETSGLKLTSQFDALDGMFTSDVEIHIYRIVQECLNNIVKHAQATQAFVTIECDDRQAVVKIQDNGRGFSPGALDNDLNAAAQEKSEKLRRGGFGLTGLAERTRIIGGLLAIDSAPGRGTTITIRVPKSAANRPQNTRSTRNDVKDKGSSSNLL